MNVVGKVGSLISQGVYSVATPFHPFGGAVDVIVVQQQDGTFRSTPWYVRFGKFQGVLKGAEKIVKITVNGVVANFHMYLDNSGEAYFIREVDSGKESEADGVLKDNNIMGNVHDGDGDNRFDDNRSENNSEILRLEHSISDSGVAQLRDSYESLCRLERTESDGSRRYYDFQDEQSPPMSEYGSSRYDNLDMENYGESQGSDSEVVLVSVDGHILTAPVSVSEQGTENVQLSTPQFHLAPGDGTEFCEGDAEFTSADDSWASNYISKVDSSQAKIESDKVCSTSTNGSAFDPHQHSDSENVSDGIKSEDALASCLELSELSQRDQIAKIGELGLTLEAQHSQEEVPHDTLIEDETAKDADLVEIRKDCELSLSKVSESSDSAVKNGSQEPEKVQTTEECRLVSDHDGSRRISVESPTDSEEKDEQLSATAAVDSLETQVATCAEEIQQDHVTTKYQGSERTSIDTIVHSGLKDERLSTLMVTEGPDQSIVESGKGEIPEIQAATSSEDIRCAHEHTRFEISLCGDELHLGMGLRAAAQVFDAHRISSEEYKNSAASILESQNLVLRIGDKYLPFEKAIPIVLGKAAFDLDLPMDPNDLIPVEKEEIVKSKDDDTVMTPSSSGRRWRFWPNPFRRVHTIEHTSSNVSSEEVFVDTESGVQNSKAEAASASEVSRESPRRQFVRTNVPTNEQIASLNLKDGQNMITFSFSTRVLGKQQVDAHIYLWRWNAKIVISDVDGTITKSDVLGQFMPLVGKDWTQSGVAKLFSAIKENGYQLLFLSARAIVQAYLTRNFLLNLKQDGKALPNGPVVISPDGLFPALYREVIRRAPHEFKIACLEDIRKLFSPDYNPFYAGFGNRDTDELSYRKLGIPKGKIFIINPKGEIATGHRTDVKTYTSLHTLVNDMFPPTSLAEQEDYNSWNFWKMPLEEID